MMSESSRMFVAGGVLIGALALATLGLRFGNRESSAKEADGHIDASLASGALPVIPDAPVDDPQNAGIARVLQAVHDSLQSNDLASARVLLDAVLTMRANEPQALMLQKELAAREAMARGVQTSTFDRQGDARSATHAHASRKTLHARVHHVTDHDEEEDLSVNNPPPPVDIRSTSAKNDTTSDIQNAQPEPEAATQTATTTTTEEPPAPPAAPVIAPGKPNDEAPGASIRDASKTRADVRDELNRARSDGSMSRFGNPDPYGPGGASSRDTQPSARNW
ncbi:hypothetical protein G3N95_27330 [Paraburkholderia sp. Tr-20389]|uniref:hypothetical protein n=1 Tax=Paraburkholderia sp. Tr-20389 TaxID=2703903 RepID=UPI00197E74E8|nr:hypothetical protein [Paraburkholderia sp. Tr-20389]MBN3756678.1 hypothetical protein [Paraburkholderia sp. Tr-20389]